MSGRMKVEVLLFALVMAKRFFRALKMSLLRADAWNLSISYVSSFTIDTVDFT